MHIYQLVNEMYYPKHFTYTNSCNTVGGGGDCEVEDFYFHFYSEETEVQRMHPASVANQSF